jgi:putative transcriptional regulator
MTAVHHPSDETLLRCAAGSLSAGPAIVVRAHTDTCQQCRRTMARFEAVGGALLKEIEPTPLNDAAFDDVLLKIDASVVRPMTTKPLGDVSMPNGNPYPRSLAHARIGKFRWLGPGFRRSNVAVAGHPRANLMLMHIGAARKMPDHGHTGVEYTLVLSGSFSDQSGRYVAGDFIELDSSVEHQPIVDPDGACLCLAALEGDMRLKGVIGRFMQWFMRA